MNRRVAPLVVLLCAVIAGAIGLQIGRLRGRVPAGLGWGFFLGPLGWLIVLTGPDLRPKCPECGGVVEPGRRRCMNCGAERDLQDTVPIRAPVEPPRSSDGLFDIEFERELGGFRPVVVFNCLACGKRTRTPVPSERRQSHRLSCDCGFTLTVSNEELIGATLEAGTELGERGFDDEC